MFQPLERIWTKNYDKEVPHEVKIPEHETLLSIFEDSTKTYKNKVAFYNLGGSMTFNKLREEAYALASYFQNNLGLKKGDRIAIQLPNLMQSPVAIYAAFKAGLIVVNTNPLYTGSEMLFQFNDSGAKAIIILENFLSKLDEVIDKSPIKHVIATSVGDYLPFPKRTLVNFVIKNIKKAIPKYSITPTWWNDVIIKGKENEPPPISIVNTDIAFLQYTGGTTGQPKAAMLTHRNIIANYTQVEGCLKSVNANSSDFVCSPLPFYHIFALTCNLFVFLKLGCSNLLITNPKEFNSFVKELRKYPITVMTGVNTLFKALLQHKNFHKINWSRFKFMIAGGSALQTAVAEEFKVRTTKTITEGYGLTETSPMTSANPFIKKGKFGTVGLPFPNTDICFLDENQKVLPRGATGEIAIKGPHVMLGYWQRPEETSSVLKDGWFITGDIGFMDEEGFIKIVDRKKDMILVSGFNVYPNEVEEILAKHPAVLDCAVVGVEDVQSGERPVAVIILKPNMGIHGKDLRLFCKKFLTSYKVPKDYLFVDELPKSNVGKILRRVVKQKILNGDYPRG